MRRWSCPFIVKNICSKNTPSQASEPSSLAQTPNLSIYPLEIFYIFTSDVMWSCSFCNWYFIDLLILACHEYKYYNYKFNIQNGHKHSTKQYPCDFLQILPCCILAALKVKLKRPFPVSVTKQGPITGRTLGHHHQPVLDLTATDAAASSAYAAADGTFRENEMCRMWSYQAFWWTTTILEN